MTIGDGTANAIEGQEMCQRIELELPELTIGTEFLAINLGKLGVVLGIPWLWSTGFMGVHWPSKSLAFMIGNKTVILKGDPALTTEDKVISNFPPSTLRTRCFLSRPVILDPQFYTHKRRGKKGNKRATGRGVIYTWGPLVRGHIKRMFWGLASLGFVLERLL